MINRSRRQQPGFYAVSVCLLAASAWLTPAVSVQSQTQTQASAAGDSCQALTDISVILSLVTEQFYDRRFNGLNWPAEISAAVEATACDESPADVARRVNALLSRLQASHTEVHSQQDLDYWGLSSLFHFEGLDAYPLPFPGIWATRHDEGWFADQVLNGSAAWQAGVRAGDELISLNGEMFLPLAFSEGSSQLEISSDGDSTRTLQIDVPLQSVMRAFVDASIASAQTISIDGANGEKSVGYYHVWAARDQILRDFQANIDGFVAAEVDALIVDLRGGFGGASEEYLGAIRLMQAQRAVPVYFLIDDSVRSGKELLASVARRDQLGTLVGSTTAGYYLSGRVNRVLDERYFLYVAVGEYPRPAPQPIEGVGVAADIEVAPCRQHCNGRDPVLERALEIIAQ